MSQLQHHPWTRPTTLRKPLRAGVSHRLAVRTASNAPSPSPHACFYGNFPRSAEAASLAGDKRSAPSHRPWVAKEPGWPQIPRTGLPPQGPSGWQSSSKRGLAGRDRYPKGRAETAETTGAGTPRRPDRPSVPFTGLLAHEAGPTHPTAEGPARRLVPTWGCGPTRVPTGPAPPPRPPFPSQPHSRRPR